MHLTPEELHGFQSALSTEAEHLRKQLKNLSAESEFGNDTDSLEEESDETEEITNQFGTRTVLEDRLVEVNAALDRIARGSYGICTSCGSELSSELLRLNPESSLCRECKKRES